MREVVLPEGRFRYYTPDETARDFIPLRNRIFDISRGDVTRVSKRIFLDPSWTKVIICGGLMFSDRSPQSRSFLGDDEVDPRDELQPLFDILTEDSVDEVIHMSPYDGPIPVGTPEGPVTLPVDAIGTDPTRSGVEISDSKTHSTLLQERLLFDRTGRWGLFASEEMFGLLGGEPGFIDRYVERAGGWDFVRANADAFWQREIDYEGYEAPCVPHYYALAGWDNPPTKRG